MSSPSCKAHNNFLTLSTCNIVELTYFMMVTELDTVARIQFHNKLLFFNRVFMCFSVTLFFPYLWVTLSIGNMTSVQLILYQ